MKKAIIYLLTIALITACSETPMEKNSASKFDEGISQSADFNNLLKLGESFLHLSNESELRQLVYHQINKRFDGDDNVLIEQLLEESNRLGYQSRINVLLEQNTNKM